MMNVFMSPYFNLKQPSIAVSLVMIRSWWYLVVVCHRLKYMNNFTSVSYTSSNHDITHNTHDIIHDITYITHEYT